MGSQPGPFGKISCKRFLDVRSRCGDLMLLFSNMSDETPGFSLELSSDLRDMRDWVHEFAA